MTTSLEKPVLVVDDDPFFGELVSEWLTEEGFSAVWLKTGEEALKRYLDRPPRAAVLDGLLPGMRGDELARRLRSRHDARTLPIVFVSSFFRDLKSYRYLTQECGVSAVLHKPLTKEELVGTLRRQLGQERHASIEIPIELFTPPPRPGPGALAPAPLPGAEQDVQDLRASVDELASSSSSALRVSVITERLRIAGQQQGRPDVVRLAEAIQSIFAEGPPEAPARRARISGLVEAMAGKLGRGLRKPIAVTADAGVTPNLALLDGETALAASCRAAAAEGQPFRVFSTLESMVADIGEAALAPEARPDLALVSEEVPGLDALEAVRRLRAAGVESVALISREESHSHLLGAVEAGACGRLPRVYDAESLSRLSRSFVRRHGGTSLLALDPDPVFLAQLAEVLADRRVAVHPCPRPLDLFEALKHDEASLVVMNLDGPFWSGVGLLRALRADASRRRVQVLALSASVQPSDAFDAGADDFLRLPFAASELIGRVVHLIERDVQHRRETQTDHLTGLMLRRPFLESAQRSITLARRTGRTAALLLLDFDSDEVVRAQGHGALAEVALAVASHLRSSFRSSDLMARLGAGRFVVLLHDAPFLTAHALLESTLRVLNSTRHGAQGRGFSVPVRGSVASFPEVSQGADALLAAGELLLTKPAPG